MVKNSAVSTEDPITLEITGACHHFAARIRSKIATSRSCAVRNAIPEPSAIQRHQRPELPHDLRPDQRAGDTHQKARENNAPRGGDAVDAVHDVGDEEGQRIGERPPGQPLAEQELDEDVGGDDDRRHRQDTRQILGIHVLFPF
jgi:hypothetical protein